jgi:imidazole glycerol-phosphate synthase subunit HisF
MALRIIPRLDIKAPNLVKGIKLEGLRVIGDPANYAKQYFEDGADEIIYQDIVASLYNRSNITNLVLSTAKQVFVPLTVGGGIRTLDDIQNLLRMGADKVCINTAVVKRPAFLKESTKVFGAQCIAIAIETIRQPNGHWKVFTDNGREHAGLDALEWAKQCVDMGVGELVLTSVDQEGTMKGFDLEFISELAKKVPVPVVAHGGAGSLEDILECAETGVDGIAIASLLHYKKTTVSEIKHFLKINGIEVRE